MTLVTLVGKGLARVGTRFVYAGPLPECKECRTKTVCLNLVVGKCYVVTVVREKEHDCRINGGLVQIVEVEEVRRELALPKRIAIEGSTISYEEKACGDVSCQNYPLCRPFAVPVGSKVKIFSAKGPLKCGEDRKMVLVEVG